jgi:glutathione peroxidase
MNKLVELYGSRGLIILGCPCNQFGHQENLNEDEILRSLKYVRPGRGYIPNFLITEKVNVNGSNESPLFKILKRQKSRCADKKQGGMIMADPHNILWKPVRSDDIAWNFEKFLIDKSGNVYRRYSKEYETIKIARDIEKIL